MYCVVTWRVLLFLSHYGKPSLSKPALSKLLPTMELCSQPMSLLNNYCTYGVCCTDFWVMFWSSVSLKVVPPVILEVVSGGLCQTPSARQWDQQRNATCSDKKLGLAGRTPACAFCMLKNVLPSVLSLLPVFIVSGLASQFGSNWQWHAC